MADPVSILGTVVGVASLAIQATQILTEYCSGVSSFRTDVEELLNSTQQLGIVLKRLEEFLDRNKKLFSTAGVPTHSTLYSANIRCEIRLRALIDHLEIQSQGSKARRALRALQWPFKSQETRRISFELQGYTQTFQFALTIEGCQLMLKTADEVSGVLRKCDDMSKLTVQTAADISLVLQAVASLPQSTLAIKNEVRKLDVRAQDDEARKALDWLAGTDASSKHQAVRKPRLANTGQWFIGGESFKEWQKCSKPILWCQGKAGVGKSVLMSCVVDKLLTESPNGAGVGYFYSDYSQDAQIQTPEAILANFVRQLILQLHEVPNELVALYEHHRKYGTRPEVAELITLLERMSGNFSRIWLLLDALDELDPLVIDDLMDIVETLMEFSSVLITSRPRSISSRKINERVLHYTISAQAWDLEVVIRSRLARAAIAPRRLRETSKWDAFVNDAVGKLVYNADGMFILVSFQLEMLLRPRTLTEMRQVLETVPQRLPDFYALTMKRIQERESDLAIKTLAWLTKCVRPLHVDELREALAVEHSTTLINPEALLHPEDVLEMCCGLVTIDHAGIVSFAHATVHEYLLNSLELIRDFDRFIAKTCLDYLSFRQFSSQTTESMRSGTFRDKFVTVGRLKDSLELLRGTVNDHYAARVNQNPFLAYAGKYWIKHVELAPKSNDLLDVAEVLLQSDNRSAMLQAGSDNKDIIFSSDFTDFHAVAMLGSFNLAQRLVDRATRKVAKLGQTLEYLARIIDTPWACGNTPLLLAVLQKNHSIAKLLLETNAVNPSVQDNTIVRLALQWKNEELLLLMFASKKFNAKLARRQFPCVDKYFSSIECGETPLNIDFSNIFPFQFRS